MGQYEEGLHKDVSVIFQGMTGFKKDGVQQTHSEPGTSTTGHRRETPPTQDQHIQRIPGIGHRGRSSQKGIWPGEPRLPAVMKAFVRIAQHIFPSRRKREEKRLVERRKHLLMNLQSEQTAGAVGCSPGPARPANQQRT